MKPSGARQRFSQLTGSLCKGKVAIVSFTSPSYCVSKPVRVTIPLQLGCTPTLHTMAAFRDQVPLEPSRRRFWVIASVHTAHLYAIGMSGKGKSKLLEWCLYQDIATGRGCGLIDPHSLQADDLLRLLITRNVLDDPDIRHRLIYVDPARTDYVVPFNVLAPQAEHPYDIAAAVLEAFRRTWPECLKEAPHFSNVVAAALIVLIYVFIDQKWPDADAHAAPAHQRRVPGAVS
jgi:hypothetical protein